MVVAAYEVLDADPAIEALKAAQDAARSAHDRFMDAAASYSGADSPHAPPA
jgi:hypothetical protein